MKRSAQTTRCEACLYYEQQDNNLCGDGIAERYNRALISTLSMTGEAPYTIIPCFCHLQVKLHACHGMALQWVHRPPKPLVAFQHMNLNPSQPEVQTRAKSKIMYSKTKTSKLSDAMVSPHSIGEVVPLNNEMQKRVLSHSLNHSESLETSFKKTDQQKRSTWIKSNKLP